MRFSATYAQRENIEQLRAKLDLDPLFITMRDKPALNASQMTILGNEGLPIDDFMRRLTGGQASAYISALQAQAGEA